MGSSRRRGGRAGRQASLGFDRSHIRRLTSLVPGRLMGLSRMLRTFTPPPPPPMPPRLESMGSCCQGATAAVVVADEADTDDAGCSDAGRFDRSPSHTAAFPACALLGRGVDWFMLGLSGVVCCMSLVGAAWHRRRGDLIAEEWGAISWYR